MKLDVDFSSLIAAVTRMGPPVDIDPLTLNAENPPLVKKELQAASTPPPELEIPEGGLEVSDLSQLETPGDLLMWQGQQVLLYIQDHRSRFEDAEIEGAKGNRVHISFCQKLEEMRARGRFERYVVTRDHSEYFHITGRSYGGREQTAMTDLKVCKLCLRKLNYGGYAVPGNKAAFNNFSFVRFFEQYDSFFPYHPSRKPGASESYTQDWKKVSQSYRAAKSYRCENCAVDLSQHPYLLHTHHINGVRSDNTENNLKALCIDCHSKESNHGHMAVPHKIRQEIAQLRQEQRKANIQTWHSVFMLADPGINGIIYHLKAFNSPLPEVGFGIRGTDGNIVIRAELAWPSCRVGVAISKEDAAKAKLINWNLYSVGEFFENPGKFLRMLKIGVSDKK
ncbi:hypothetical protein GCM10022228_11090 [Halomonas cibimaris]|uniref:HNH nuclease domain-containing protein n=1 Tax=Halomonas cibimaris TaxID=657012 RepID=A0ABP7LJQ3_9GAMM